MRRGRGSACVAAAAVALLRCCSASTPLGDPYSCELAEGLPSNAFCAGVVDWATPRQTDGTTSSQRDAAAHVLAARLAPTSEPVCRAAALQYACAHHFPKCLLARASTSYWQVCRSTCERVKALCSSPTAQSLDCARHLGDERFCVLVLPDDALRLDPAYGPFDAIPDIMLASIGVWLAVVRGRRGARAFLISRPACPAPDWTGWRTRCPPRSRRWRYAPAVAASRGDGAPSRRGATVCPTRAACSSCPC